MQHNVVIDSLFNPGQPDLLNHENNDFDVSEAVKQLNDPSQLPAPATSSPLPSTSQRPTGTPLARTPPAATGDDVVFSCPPLFSAAKETGQQLSKAQLNSTKALWEEVIWNVIESMLNFIFHFMQFGNMRKAMEKQWILSNKGFRAWRSEMQDQTQLIRELKHEIFTLKSQLYDKKAVESNLPHKDLNKLIPFRSDEDVITCLDNTDLNNALFSKVTRINLSPHMYVYAI